jgi:hypothetical protein
VRRLLEPRWLAWHALALVLIAGCLALGFWQLRRAIGGNTLSWAYTVNWPLFAGFVVWMWIRAVRDELARARGEDPYQAVRPEPLRPRTPAPEANAAMEANAAVEASGDDELDAYNRYLAWLAANPDRKPSDYRAENPSG